MLGAYHDAQESSSKLVLTHVPDVCHDDLV